MLTESFSADVLCTAMLGAWRKAHGSPFRRRVCQFDVSVWCVPGGLTGDAWVACDTLRPGIFCILIDYSCACGRGRGFTW